MQGQLVEHEAQHRASRNGVPASSNKRAKRRGLIAVPPSSLNKPNTLVKFSSKKPKQASPGGLENQNPQIESKQPGKLCV